MAVFPTAAHLVAWARFAPQANTSGRQGQGGGHRQGQPVAGRHPRPRSPSQPGRTSTFGGERYRRIANRRGKQRALVAVGNSVLTIIWHLLADPHARSCDLGPDLSQSHSSRHRQERNLIRQLQQLTGKTLTLTPRPTTPAA
jgi:transposase